VSILTGVSKVLVTDTPSEGGSEVAHSLQYLESEGFSVLHLGQLIGTVNPFPVLAEEYQIRGNSVNKEEKLIYIYFWKFFTCEKIHRKCLINGKYGLIIYL